MADWRRLGVGMLVLGLLAGGCGRESNQVAVPAVQAIAFAPQGASTATAEAQLTDMGTILELSLTGQGFTPNGIYSVEPLTAYQIGAPASAPRCLAHGPSRRGGFGSWRAFWLSRPSCRSPFGARTGRVSMRGSAGRCPSSR